MSTPRSRLLVLLSGRGSNFEALAEACDHWLDAEIVAVISDRADAGGVALAQSRGLDSVVVDRSLHPSRNEFETSLAAAIDGFEPDLIVLAGFMRVLSADLVGRYPGRMINIHPSLLPRYRGLDTHRRALEAGDTEHGASVHFVTAELDGGPIISRARMAIQPGDTPEALAQRLLPLEHRLLPASVALLLQVSVERRYDTFSTPPDHRPDRAVELGATLDDHGHRLEP